MHKVKTKSTNTKPKIAPAPVYQSVLDQTDAPSLNSN